MNESFILEPTADGSFTFFSTEFGESFHSRYGANQEALIKFVEPTRLREKAEQSRLQILDICYGLSYNTAAALETIWAVNPSCQIEWIGLEFNLAVAQEAVARQLLNSWSASVQEILTQLASVQQVKTDRFQGKLLIGDARQTLPTVKSSGFQADAIFLDPFSPPTCPQLWTVEFLGLVAQCLKPEGRLATYSCAAAVRTALSGAGLNIGSTVPLGRRSPGTVASFTTTHLPPLSQEEQEHLQTRAAIPYRDPDLSDTAKTIQERREAEQELSILEPTSRWKKRWLKPRKIDPSR